MMDMSQCEFDSSLETSLKTPEHNVDMNDSISNSLTVSTDKMEEDNRDLSPPSSKNGRRSLLERQLEINMTPKMLLVDNSSPESPNKSRYGRARKQKTVLDFYPTDLAFHMKSVKSKSPSKLLKNIAVKPHKSVPILKSPKMFFKKESPKHDNVTRKDEDKPVFETKIIHTPWNKQLDKKPLKVYVRKDLIQTKVKTSAGSGSLIQSILSYTPPLYDSLDDVDFTNQTPEKDKSIEFNDSEFTTSKTNSPKKSLNLKKTHEIKTGVKLNNPNEYQTMSNVKNRVSVSSPVKMMASSPNFYEKSSEESKVNSCLNDTSKLALSKKDGKKKSETKEKSPRSKGIKSSSEIFSKIKVEQVPSENENDGFVTNEIQADEKNAEWSLGELLWARVGSHPFWPCLVTRDPLSWRFVRKKKVGRSLVPAELYHVTYFGDSGRRSWLLSKCLMKFEGLDRFNKTKAEFTPEMKRSDPKYIAAFDVRDNKKNIWLSGVQEAESLLHKPREEREDFFMSMFLLNKKEKKTKKDKNEEVSLSESMLNGLFNTKGDKVSTPLKIQNDILNDDEYFNKLAAKTENAKIKVQSHMDRWLLKAKNPKLSLQKPQEITQNTNHSSTTEIVHQNKESDQTDTVEVPSVVSKDFNVNISSDINPKVKPKKMSLLERRKSVATFHVSPKDKNKTEKTKSNDSLQASGTNASKTPVLRRRMSIAYFGCTERHSKNTLKEPKSQYLTDSSHNQSESFCGENKELSACISNSEARDIGENNEDVSRTLRKKKVVNYKDTKLNTSLENDVDDKLAHQDRDTKLKTKSDKDSDEKLVSKESNGSVDQNNTDEYLPKVQSDCALTSTKSRNLSELQISQSSEWESEQEEVMEGKKHKVSKYEDEEFKEFVEFKRDTLLEENPNLTEEQITSYLYKIWQYGENTKMDDVNTAEDYCLVKGMTNEEAAATEPKKQRKRNKIHFINDEQDEENFEPEVPREKSLRKKTIKSYFTKDSSLSDDEDLETPSKIEPADISKPKIEKSPEASKDKHDIKSSTKKSKEITQMSEGEQNENMEKTFDYYMESLKVTKPSIFKGLIKDKVCSLCEKASNLTKCKGVCGNLYHIECVRNQLLEPPMHTGLSKRRKKRGKKRKTHDNSTTQDSKNGSSLEESIIDECLGDDDNNDSPEIIKPVLNGDIELHLSPTKDINGKNDVCVAMSIVTDANNFESQMEKRMQEMLETTVNEELDISSTSMDVDNEWSDVKAGDCVIVDVVEYKKSQLDECSQSSENNTDCEFKCNDCLKYDTPLCFVCKSEVCIKNSDEDRQKCNVQRCNKYYHIECLKAWPQTKYSTSCSTKIVKKNQVVEAMSCPRHVCHTCVSDDPRGSGTRFSGEKLARCMRCPATYHCFTKCIPAGTRLLTASLIICPRHNDDKVSKMPYHVNTSWCFICAKGGSLICCETCPTSFHAECLKISPPEGGYICEDCETGRLPLYEEIVWVKLGQYRWWPALVLHPADVPPNIAALSHASNQFAVRFFGDYDHYWVYGGRVFLYQEDDTGRASSKKSAVDMTFLNAMKQAQEAYSIIKNMKQHNTEDDDLVSSLLPPQFVKLKVNRAVGGAALNYKNDKTCAQKCECDPNSKSPCAPDSDCINRMLLTECSPSVCAAGEKCCNQAFEKRQYPSLVPNKTQHRGWGLKTLSDIKKGEFVIEYVGEIIDEAEFQRRMARKREIRDENYYFLTLDKDRMIDAGPKGNVARFMNHSCEPNCETQKWTVNGDTRVGLFALEDIPAGSEVTFNYNLLCADDDKKKCMCGAKRCAGFIGAKLKQHEPVPKNSKKTVMKRKYNRKSLNNSVDRKSPQNAKTGKSKNLSVEKEKRKSTAQSRTVEEDSIEKDWKEINEATQSLDNLEEKVDKADCSEDSMENSKIKLQSNIEECKKTNLPCVRINPISMSLIRSNQTTGDSFKLDNTLTRLVEDNKSVKGEKRKLSLDADEMKKNKRTRSDSTFVESDKNSFRRSDKLPVNSNVNVNQLNGTTSPKKGRPRKSLVQNEI